jgi:hypothetical protein
MRRSLIAACAVLASVALSIACDNSSGSTPASPAPILSTATFTGTVDPGGNASNPFTVGQSGGEVDITLTAAGPPPTIFMGLGVGTPSTDGTTCTVPAGQSVNTQAGATPQLVGTAGPGNYCVMVFDIGNQTATISYTVTVAHP